MRRIVVAGRREYPPAGPARPADAHLRLLRFVRTEDIERWSSDLKMQMGDARSRAQRLARLIDIVYDIVSDVNRGNMARYALSLPTNLKQAAEAHAAEQGISLNQFILWAVSEKVGSLSAGLDDPRFPRVTYRRGATGLPQPVVRGTGIRVQTIVVAHEHWGQSPEEIAADTDLSLSHVQEALAFYQVHRSEIDLHIESESRLERERGG